MSNILAELRQWANTLPYWEQAALKKIFSGSELADEDYDKLLQYLLEDANLEKPKEERPVLNFPEDMSLRSTSTKNFVKLVKVYNFQNINKLVPNQTILFGDSLSAIFGANGSGKSSYVRAIACASFSRGDREVLPDVMMPISADLKQSLDIEISDGLSNKTIHYEIGKACAELATFYVFDATSANIHLSKQNKLSFSPTSLTYLTKLADATDKVRERLEGKIQQFSISPKYIYLFQEDTNISKLFAKLESDNNITALRELATLSEQEQQKKMSLEIKIAKLKSEDVSYEIQELTQEIADLEDLSKSLKHFEEILRDESFEKINDLIRDYVRLKGEASLLSEDQFKSSYFSQIGTPVWQNFIKSAKRLAIAEQIDGNIYPCEKDLCLLCHQQLMPEARDLLIRLWAFLASDIEGEIDKLQSHLDEERKAFENIKISPLNESAIYYKCLKDFDEELLNQIIASIQSNNERRSVILSMIDNHKIENLPPLSKNGNHYLRRVIDVLDIKLKDLKGRDQAEELLRLEKEHLELQHREILGNNLREIEEAMTKRIWAKNAAGIGSNTRHITRKYNEIFNKIVTQKYIDTFEIMLRKLRCPLRVKMDTKSRKAETFRQIILETDPSVDPEKYTPNKVLSEGEKRAVALADFLTEVAIDETSSGIILDDPVTSLDFEWKEIIATCLAREAKGRQVIVFTHDLHFLYLLKKSAEEKGIPIVTHWIKRGDQDDYPGYVYLDNSPAMEQSYRKPKKARELYEKAKIASPEDQEALLRQGFAALRTSYEAFIIYDLFNQVVTRFDERISFGRLTEIVWDKEIVEAVNEKCELLSRFIEGHLHSDAFSSKKPTPKKLFEEIIEFEKLKKKLKDLKK